MGFADWVPRTLAGFGRYRNATATPTGPGACLHDCEGGVDIPTKVGTPIYALATGPLVGRGMPTHPDGSPIYGVVTEQVPGYGDVYYQHLDLAPGLANCSNGNCAGQVVQAGQLLGWTHWGEVEVGENAGWGGPWGPNPKPGPWVGDPRQDFINLANGAPSGGATPISSDVSTPSNNNPISTLCAQLPATLSFALCGIVPPATNAASAAASAVGGASTCSPWDIQCVLKNILVDIGPLLQKLLIFTLGMVMFTLGFYLLASKASDGIISGVLDAVPTGGSPPAAAPAAAPAGASGAPHPGGKSKSDKAAKGAQVAKLAELAA